MAATTHVCSIAHVANRLGEDPELLEAIVSNDDNLTCGDIVSVHVGHDDDITALTDGGIEEPRDRLASARVSVEEWHSFLEDFVARPDIIARVKPQPLRKKPGAYDRNGRPSRIPDSGRDRVGRVRGRADDDRSCRQPAGRPNRHEPG